MPMLRPFHRFASLLLVWAVPAAAYAQVVSAPGPGSQPVVQVQDSVGNVTSFFAYDPLFTGGVRVALGDVNGDGVLDIITGAGPGGGPQVKVWNGTDLTLLASFFAYNPAFTGGVTVAAGDVDGDGHADIIMGASAGGGPDVRVVSGANFTQIVSFFAYDPAFAGGVFVAAGDVNGDGHADIITGAGPGGGPHVRVLSGADFSQLASFFPFDPAFAGGVSVASSDVNGDGFADIITGAGPGGGPHVRILSGANLSELASFFAYNPAFTGGVFVAASDFNGDGEREILTAAGPGGWPHVRVFNAADLVEIASFLAFDPSFAGGVFLGSIAGSGGVRFTSANATSFTVGVSNPFTITTTGGGGSIVLTETGALPGGVTFTDNGDGTATLTGPPAGGSGGTYPLLFTATPTTGSPVTQSFTLTVQQAPAITSGNTVTFNVGVAGSFNVTTTGFPAPTVIATGALPSGVTFTDNGNGTATLAGPPASGTAGSYPLTITASNGVGSAATQTLTLTVTQDTAITSANATTFTVGAAGSFTITTAGSPPATTITLTGALPSPVTFTNNGNGTATLAGTPAAGTGGIYTLQVTASNGVSSPATQTFTLTVNQAPQITSAASATFTVGVAGSFTVTTTGFPVPTIGSTVGLPTGVTFTDNGNGTATIAGPPGAGTGGIYSITITAMNGVAPMATQTFTLTVVDPKPVITAGGTLNYTEGNPPTAIDGTITVTDPDSLNLAFASVQITGNYVNGQDVLAFPPGFGIVGLFVPSTGTLTLSGSSSVANYQAALRTVTYFNNSLNPSTLPRTVTWTVSDGTHLSNAATSTITVVSVNSAPIGGTDSWTTFGNTELIVDQAGPTTPFVADTTPSTFGVLDNDTDPEGNPRVVTGIVGCVDTTAPFVCTTTGGGSVTMESNGRFTYRPQAGDTGADSFQYILTDVPSSGLAQSVSVTVNLTLLERIWYVNGNVAGPGTGTSSDPFNTLPGTIGDADDIIFVHDSTLTGSITLQTGQKLYGEGFGLSINQALNGNPAPTVLVPPGNHPVINATSGNAVGVLANSANGSLTNVEIRGLTLSTSGASANAIDVTTADAANVGVTISDVTVTGATAEGIDINQGSTGTATVSLSNVTVTSTGTGIDLNETAGTLTVTGFSGLTVTGNTGGTGIIVTNATFDATPLGAYNQVAGGTSTVGSLANPVTGAGIVLTNVSGDLAFTALDVFAAGGAGLLVSGTGAVNVGAGTGTNVAVTSSGTLQSTGGPVVNVLNSTVALQLASATVTSSTTTGMSLNGASGTVSATAGAIANTTGISVDISGGTVSLNYGGNITQANNVAMVSVSGHTTGTITFSGTLNATNGPGLVFDNADSTTSYNFTGTTTLNGGDAGIDILNGSAGTFTFGSGTTITNPSGTAFQLSSSNANVTYSGSISDNSGFAVDISGHAAGTVTFQTGSITSTGTGIQVANNGGLINFNSPSIQLTTGANKAVTLDVGNTGGTINFAPAGGNGLDISTTTGIGFSALGGGTISVSGAGNTINSTGAMAIEISTATIGAGGVTFASTSSGAGTRNIKLTSVTGGAIALGTGTLTGATGAAFLVGDGAGGATTGGTSAITYGGTITSTGTARAVDIQDRAATAGNITLSNTITHSSGNANVIFLDGNAAGTIAFSGPNSVLNGGTSTAVSLTNNTGATINFTGGGLDIDSTTGTGFLATGGGTVNVTGTLNTIATTTGTALNVTNTTIGASRLLFRSISSNGGSANGIILDTTGASGGLTVDGDGTNTTVGGNSSGGTITGKSGADGSATTGSGIYLNATSSVILRRMTINGTNQNFGIRGVNVNGFTMEYTTVSGSNGDNAGIDEGSVNFDNLLGSAAITSSVIEGGFEDNLNVVNTSGTLNRLVITGSTFGFNNTVSGNNNILIESQNAGTTLNFTIQSSTIKGARADWVNASNNSSSTMDVVIGGIALGNTFDNLGANAHPGAAAGGNRVVLGSVGTMTFDVNSNTLRGSKGEAIRVRSTATLAVTGTATGHVRNNVIGVQGTANSGSSEGSGIFAIGDGGSDMTIAIAANTVHQYNNHGIRLDFGDEINDGSVFNATVTGNTVSTPGNINTDFNAIHLNNGTVAATDNFTSCVNIGGAGALANSVSGGGSGTIPPNNTDIRLRQRQSTTVRLPGYGGANNDDAAVVAFLAGRNTLSTAAASNTVPTGGGFIGGAACAVPPF
jgi:Bacterial Ig domain/FG-GAP-like repeat